MSWKSAADTTGEGSKLPILAIEPNKSVRIRLLGKNASPLLNGTKYADGPIDLWSHWTPNELNEELGLKVGRIVPCIGPRNGCIFHQQPLDWKASRKSMIPAIVYVGWDAKKKTVDERKMTVFSGGSKVWTQIVQNSEALGKEPDEIDWMIHRAGAGQNDTTYTATPLGDLLDPNLELTEFDELAEFQDANLPMIYDPTTFSGREITTKAQQEEWYAKLISEASETGEPPASSSEPPGAPGTAPSAASKPATPSGAPISLGARRGRLSNEEKAAKEAFEKANPGQTWVRGGAPAATVTPPPPATALKPATPPAPPANKHAEAMTRYKTASIVLDPWGKKMAESQYLAFIANATEAEIETYHFTSEQINAAKIVAAGEPVAPPSGPPLPPSPPTPPAVDAEAQDEEESADIGELRAELLKLTKSSPTLQNYSNLKKFFTAKAGGVKAVGQIEDVELLESLIELCSAGEEAIVEAIG